MRYNSAYYYIPCMHGYSNDIIYFRHIQQYLTGLLQAMANKRNIKNVSYLTKCVHVWPDFHGNRSPLADPTLKGMVEIIL